nr:GntR family transcriptional regulator [Rhizomicrobium palustre]
MPVFLHHFWVDLGPPLYGTALVLSLLPDKPASTDQFTEGSVPSLSAIIGRLNEEQNLPLYQQLQRGLRRAIEMKLLNPEDALPPERDLAEEFNVSRITVRKALDGLVSEGLLMRRQGSGTFVASRVEKSFSKLSSFTEDMTSRGKTPRSVWLRKSQGVVSPEEAMSTGFAPGTPVYRFNRLRYADDTPMALEFCTVPAFALPSLEAVQSSLYDALEKAGNRPRRALQRLRAVLLTAPQTELLHGKEGDAGLLVERRGFLQDGRTVEFSQSYYCGDTYDFVAELTTSE